MRLQRFCGNGQHRVFDSEEVCNFIDGHGSVVICQTGCISIQEGVEVEAVVAKEGQVFCCGTYHMPGFIAQPCHVVYQFIYY